MFVVISVLGSGVRLVPRIDVEASAVGGVVCCAILVDVLAGLGVAAVEAVMMSR